VRAILILTAVELETRALARELELRLLPSLPFPAFGGGGLRVAPVGLGASALGSRWPFLLAGLDRPLVISAGVCGGLDPRLGPGDLVVPERVAGPAGERYDVTPSRHRAAVAPAPPASTGLLVTTREVVATPAAKADLFARTGAVAADMESSLILSAAAAAGLPSLVVRGVADGARQSLPPALIGLVAADGRMRLAGAMALVTRPAVLPRALGLRRATRRALRAVAGLLAALTG
jgi:adenosylhomocysteine nucleosidase